MRNKRWSVPGGFGRKNFPGNGLRAKLPMTCFGEMRIIATSGTVSLAWPEPKQSWATAA